MHTQDVMFSQLLTLPLFLSLLSCSLSLVFHTHTGKPCKIQPPLVTFAGVILGETSAFESVSS